MPTASLQFRPMTTEDTAAVAEMVKALYRSLEAPDDYMTDEKIAATFRQLTLQPSHLQLEIFEKDNAIAGYALSFRYWYSEFGGMVLNIDELFVKPEFRGHGIASEYLSALSQKKGDYIALSLEVLPENEGAYALYKRAGFEKKTTDPLYKLLEP